MCSSDLIIPNETEFAGMHPRGLRPDSDSIIKELSDQLGCRFAVTLGENGAAYCDNSGTISRVRAPKVNAIDTTGAGDAFVGAFAFGLASGLSDQMAAELGCICASDSVTRLGTQSSYPTPDQAKSLLAQVANG